MRLALLAFTITCGAQDFPVRPVKIIVPCAGIHADAPLPAMKGDTWDRVLRTNLDGFYTVAQPLLMPMIRRHDGGRVVAISSIAALAGNRGQANYAASKATST